MSGVADYWVFVAAVLAFLMLPGQGAFALLTSTGQGGFRTGASATFGLIARNLVPIGLAALGVGAALQANPTLFKLLQYAGAAYLAWMGIRLALARPGGTQPIAIRAERSFGQAFLITLLNPKAIVFYTAFFPLFVDPATHRGALTFAAMAVSIALVTLACCLLLAAFAHAVAARVRAHRKAAQWLERSAGVFVVGFGIKRAQ